MKNYGKYLLGALVVGALYYFAKLKKTADVIKVNLANVKLKKGSGLSLPTIVMSFDIQNPTNNPVNVKGVVGDVYINGQYVANVSNLNQVKIPANGSTIYSVDVKAGISDTISTLISLLKKKKAGESKGVTITANLNVNVDDILYPVDINRKLV